MKKICFVSALLLTFCAEHMFAQSTLIQYLSGTGKDDTVDWDFFCTKGMRSGKWTKIAVPSNWEQQGFGGYSYGHDKIKTDEQGLYKHRFDVPASWRGKNTFIVFEGSMTDTEVKVNGKSAGKIHQGGFYRFKYDITALLVYGRNNLLEVTVSKMSAEASVNRAERNGDFWTLGGIYRPVYLEVKPAQYIDRVAIDAKADGSFNMQVFTGGVAANVQVEAQVASLAGVKLGETFSAPIHTGDSLTSLNKKFDHPLLWNPESPQLYSVIVSIRHGEKVLHTITQRFGFRTTELRLHDGFYVNGTRVIFKGVCRHSEWPETGRTLNKAISVLDVSLMKEMNMNAVRMSHYPPDTHFLDVCDSLGLFVLDELTGWQAAYDTVAGRPLVKEMVTRDVNHPCVVIWDNGNEGGWNRGLDNDYQLYDPQKRLVIHPWEKFNGTDTKHYPDYNYVINSALYDREVFFPTEFMHGLYDGGQGAGLEDFWNAILQHPYGTGGFLWSFHDEGIVRKDRHDSIDTDGNHAPDGILGPHREKEASFYTIKELWSPVMLTRHANGTLQIENRYLFTHLEGYTLHWKLSSFAGPHSATDDLLRGDSGSINLPALVPGSKSWIDAPIDSSMFNNADAVSYSILDPQHHVVCAWSWPTHSPAEIAKKYITTLHGDESISKVNSKDQDSSFVVNADSILYYFSKTTGTLREVVTLQGKRIPLNGPVTAGVNHTLKELRHSMQDGQLIVEPVYDGPSAFSVKWIFGSGHAVRLDYSYTQKGSSDFTGISFYYPEEQITGIKWMGRGPYRVWKNRLKGQQFGVWSKRYNNTVTGETWEYPEFKGYHADLYWVNVETRQAPFTIYNGHAGMFLQIMKPGVAAAAGNANTNPPFPDGAIGIMSAIPAIGTKFQSADKLGPQSQPNIQLNSPVSGTLWLEFK